MSAAPASRPEPASPAYTWAAVAIAGATVLGGFYLSAAEGKYPCPLCFYQRSFALAVLGLLLVGVVGKMNDRVSVATLALPIAFAGLGVALWHVRLQSEGKLICPSGMFGISTAPTQSAVMFGLLCATLVIDAYQAGRQGSSVAHVLGGAVLGIALAAVVCDPAGMWKSNAQPKRAIPAEEYPEDEKGTPKICLPPKPE